jgi:hypothetical protein
LVGRIERGGGLVWIRDFRSDAVGNENGNQRGQKAIQLIYLLFVSFCFDNEVTGAR